MTAVRVVGIDPSLTSTGIARLTHEAGWAPQTFTDTVGHPGTDNLPLLQRARRILDAAVEVVSLVPGGTDLVVIEQPAYGSTTGDPHDRAGLWWEIVTRLVALGVQVVEVNPSHLKMWATGRGNAAKPAVVQRVVAQWGEYFTLPTGKGRNDVADAVALATLGAAHLGHHLADLPDEHTRALGRVAWPVP